MATVTTHDPRYVDGEAHEVATIAGQQVSEALAQAIEALEGFRWAARGAWLTAEEYRTGEMPLGEAFDKTAQGEKIAELYHELTSAAMSVRTLTAAASWNPRSYFG